MKGQGEVGAFGSETPSASAIPARAGKNPTLNFLAAGEQTVLISIAFMGAELTWPHSQAVAACPWQLVS